MSLLPSARQAPAHVAQGEIALRVQRLRTPYRIHRSAGSVLVPELSAQTQSVTLEWLLRTRNIRQSLLFARRRGEGRDGALLATRDGIGLNAEGLIATHLPAHCKVGRMLGARSNRLGPE